MPWLAERGVFQGFYTTPITMVSHQLLGKSAASAHSTCEYCLVFHPSKYKGQHCRRQRFYARRQPTDIQAGDIGGAKGTQGKNRSVAEGAGQVWGRTNVGNGVTGLICGLEQN